jgi:hypothetical protein
MATRIEVAPIWVGLCLDFGEVAGPGVLTLAMEFISAASPGRDRASSKLAL